MKLCQVAASRAGQNSATLKTSINVHGFSSDATETAPDQFYGPQAAVMDRIGRERGWGPTSRAQFDAARGPTGNLFVGDPELVAEKIVAAHRVFGNDRFLLQMARSEEHTSELQSLMRISYAVFCLKKKKN